MSRIERSLGLGLVVCWFLGSARAEAQVASPEQSEEEPEPPATKEAAGPVVLEDDEPDLPTGLDDEPDLPTGLDDEPDLPAGLDDEPELPSGLDAAEPSLPSGLDEHVEQGAADESDEAFVLPFEWRSFIDMRGGSRLVDDPTQKRASLGEVRLQLHAERAWEPMSMQLSVTADGVFDPILDEYEPELETGSGAIDLREASLVASPLESVDIKVGRQTLTWGTGDLLFINDLFPKDWNAFLVGRDMEYLKAPSDAVKLSYFNELANLDLVYTPRFDADRFPDRRRLSSWDPLQQQLVGREMPLALVEADRWFRDDEWAGRLYRRVGRYELAAYGYHGYWKSPAGFDAMTGAATFPELSVYGASARRALLGGIAHAEGGYYDSHQDRNGRDAFVRNSELRALLGFEREVLPQLTLGAQYYLEYMRNFEAYENSQPEGVALADRARHLVTVRVSYLAMRQRLRLGLFAYASPSDRDLALMPDLSYALSDRWALGAGARVFAGEEEFTFFGQLEKNSSAYASMRASF